MTMVTWCSASGRLVQKSQLFSADRRLVRGSRLTARLRSGNLWGSRMKKTGVLLPTMSRLPSSVYMRTAKPRISRSASAAPRSPATVEKRMNRSRSEEHTSELQSRGHLVCRLLLEKKNTTKRKHNTGEQRV